MKNENLELIKESDTDQSIVQSTDNTTEILKSSSIPTPLRATTKNDSGYSSFISQRNAFIRTSSPIVASINNNKMDSPGTSYSSRNSALINDEELEEMFSNYGQFVTIDKGTEKLKESSFYLARDLDYSPEVMSIRHSVRNSPWTVRPESAPLNEEDEDSEKEAQYSCSIPQEPILMTGLLNTVPSNYPNRRRRYSLMDNSEQRKDLIASKLQEIADKLNTSEVRTRHFSLSTDNIKPSTRRHSHSSFADIVPCGSAVDLIISLYDVYKSYSKATVVTSQSMVNMTPKPPRTNNRSRSYTE